MVMRGNEVRFIPADRTLDALMASFGERWNQSSGFDEEEFVRSVTLAIGRSSGSKGAKVTAFPSRWRWSVIGLAAAACLAVMVVIDRGGDGNPLGSLVYSGGQTQVTGTKPGTSDLLGSGATISTGKDGEALVAMDHNRVNLILRQDTVLSLAEVDTVTLDKGEVWVRVRPDSGFFEIKTPTGHAHIHGTTFGVKVTEGRTEVVVASGIVEIGVGDLCVDVPPGHRGSLEAGSESPEVLEANVELSPSWAVETFNRASQARYSDFFPSVATPGMNP